MATFVWYFQYHLCIYSTRSLLYILHGCLPTLCSVRLVVESSTQIAYDTSTNITLFSTSTIQFLETAHDPINKTARKEPVCGHLVTTS